MPANRNYRKQRRRFFVACEGESEYGYAAFIQHLADDAKLAIHLDIRNYRGGDPLIIVNKAVKELRERRSRFGSYSGQVIFLDADRCQEDKDRTNKAVRLIRKHQFCPIWSNPFFEVLLLKHLIGCETLQPPTPKLALKELKSNWPNYRKGMVANELAKKLDLDAVRRAIDHEPKLRVFLLDIGLLE